MPLRKQSYDIFSHNILPYNMEGCVLYLPFYQEDMQGTPIYSYDQYRYSCAVSNAIWSQAGRVMDGDDFVNLDNALPSLAATTTGTWAIWLKIPDITPAANNCLISFSDTSALEIIYIYLTTVGKIQVSFYDAGALVWDYRTTDAISISNDTFFLVELVQNGTKPAIRVNGAPIALDNLNEGDPTKWFAAGTGIDNGRLGCQLVAGAAAALLSTGTFGEVLLFNKVVPSIYEYTRWRYLV